LLTGVSVVRRRQGFTIAACICGGLAILSSFLDLSALLRMFIPWNAALTSAKPAPEVPRVRWEAFRVLNWVSSVSFLLSVARLVSLQRRGLSILFHSKVAIVVCCLSLVSGRALRLHTREQGVARDGVADADVALSQAYLLMFFGVSLIYTDLMEVVPTTIVSPTDDAPPSPRATHMALSSSNRSPRSPIGVLVMIAAAVVSLGLLVGFAVTMAPHALRFTSTVAVPWAASLVQLQSLPWLLLAVAAVVLYLRERSARRRAVDAVEAVRRNALDAERLQSYPAKCVATACGDAPRA
jgi:hypothetical protein